MAAEHKDVFHHIRDFPYLELPQFMGGKTDDFLLIPFGSNFEFQFTKFMLLQVVAGLLTLFIFMGLSWHIRSGKPARGKFWNFWEMLALFIRDEVARPAIG
jgi:F-type H+-transporting ATPase subunit a